MSNLLSIETAFLSQSEIKNALNLNDIKRIQKQITNAHKSKFSHTLTMAKLVVKAEEWFNSEDGKFKMQDAGLSWSKEEFGQKVFGWQKSFFYKVLKAGKLSEQIVDAFNTKCDEADAQGKDVDRSLAGLLKFAQDFSDVETIINEETGEEEISEEAIESAEVQERVETIFTMSMKNPEGRNVAVRINANGELITRNDASEIAQAIAFLQSAMGM
jgi:hypothetical protein